MKGLWNKLKNSQMLSGLLSSLIFLLVISPFVEPLANKVPALAGSFLSTFVDFIYSKAATASVDSFLITYIGAAIIGFYLYAATNLNKKYTALKSGLDATDNTRHNGKTPVAIKDVRDVVIVVTIFLVLFVAYFIMSAFIPTMLRVIFDETIDLIAPYTSDQVIKELRSAWIQMKSFNDYSAIKKIIEDIKTTAGL